MAETKIANIVAKTGCIHSFIYCIGPPRILPSGSCFLYCSASFTSVNVEAPPKNGAIIKPIRAPGPPNLIAIIGAIIVAIPIVVAIAVNNAFLA